MSLLHVSGFIFAAVKGNSGKVWAHTFQTQVSADNRGGKGQAYHPKTQPQETFLRSNPSTCKGLGVVEMIQQCGLYSMITPVD